MHQNQKFGKRIVRNPDAVLIVTSVVQRPGQNFQLRAIGIVGRVSMLLLLGGKMVSLVICHLLC